MKIDLHKIHAAPLHNMNRDEDGRPKTAMYGGRQRGRWSSQATKKAIRMYPDFPADRRAIRTRELGLQIFDTLTKAEVGAEAQRILLTFAINFALGGGGKAPDEEAVEELLGKPLRDATRDRVNKLGEPEDVARREALRRLLRTEQGLVISTRERAAAEAIAAQLIEAKEKGQNAQDEAFADVVKKLHEQRLLDASAVDDDIALFGRMVAASPDFEVEAAVSVSHALTTHEFAVEADYFSAGEELNVLGEKGAAITAYAFHGAGIYYQHLTVDFIHLVETLGSVASGHRALKAFLNGVLYALPSGKRNSYAHATPPAYVLASRHSGPSFNLLPAFLQPVRLDGENDALVESVARLERYYETVVQAYGLKTEHLAFIADPALRKSNQPDKNQVWTAAELEAFVTAKLPEPRARAA